METPDPKKVFEEYAVRLLQERGIEDEGQQFADTSLDNVRPLGAVEQDADGLVVALLHLEHDLTACTTGWDRNVGELAIGIGCYGKRFDSLVGVCRIGKEEGGALSAQTRGIGGILLVAARYDSAIG